VNTPTDNLEAQLLDAFGPEAAERDRRARELAAAEERDLRQFLADRSETKAGRA
jgi:hypothetical protein